MFKEKHIVTFVTLLVILFVSLVAVKQFEQGEVRVVKVGFIYNGDHSNVYTSNFLKAQNAVEEMYGDQVEIFAKFNTPDVSEDNIITQSLEELAEEGCEIIFATSYGYCSYVKDFAVKHPEIQFCQATGDNANVEPVLSNYHTFMGRIYEGRFIAGVVAGMKLSEMINKGVITEDEAVLGYIGAFPFAEVISGYTSYYLGAASIIPGIKMKVCYVNSWSDYANEKYLAGKLIEDGCIIISQHSDTAGVATACENTGIDINVYNIGYNKSMADIAPTTYLSGCRINWTPYICDAVGAVLNDKVIENTVKGTVNGQDICAGFDEGWVEMLETNKPVVADGTERVIENIIKKFKKREINVFRGNYNGIDPFNPEDIIDLNLGYKENKTQSAPSFHYVLQDVIEIVEY